MANDLAPAEFHRACFWSRWIADIHYMAPCSNYKSCIVRFIEPIYPKNVCIIVWSTLILLHAIEVRIRKFRMEFRCDLVIWGMAFKNNRAPLLCYIKFVHHFKAIAEVKLMLQYGNSQFGSKSAIFLCQGCLIVFVCPVWPWNSTDDLEKQQGTSSMLLQALCIIRSHQWIQTGITVRKRSILVKIGEFFCPVWLSNSMNDYQKQKCTSSILLYAFSIISKPLATSNLSYCPETLNSGQSQRVFNPCDLEISRMTLKNKRAPLLCSSRFFSSFNCHQCIQTGVTVWKRPI